MARLSRRSLWLTLAMVLILGLALVRSAVIVDETRFVLVTDFGKVVRVLGDQPGEAGLNGKWPWQSTLEVDRRLQFFDPPAREVITGDKRNLEVGGYVVWRVEDPERFVRTAGSIPAAEARLNERVAAALSDAIGRRDLSALASNDPKVWALDALTEEVVSGVRALASTELGVEVVDVRLRRFNHPVEVRPAVFELIRSERRKVAATFRAEGEAEYQTLTSQADRQRDTILAQADAEAERVRGQAEAEAARVSNEAHARDPKFYEFLRNLEAYRAMLDEKSTVVLSSSSPLLRLLNEGPNTDLLRPEAAKPTTAEAKPKAEARP
ncbi:MAG: protease modulator HflC [Isosphaeraceae bacterium]